MADPVFAQRVPDDLKAELESFMKDEQMQGKEFMQFLAELYKTEKARKNTPEVAEDLVELRTVTQRMFNIYLNLATRIENINQSRTAGFEEELEKATRLADSLREDVTTREGQVEALQQQLQKLEEEAVNHASVVDSLKSNIKALTDSVKDKEDLVEQFRGNLEAVSLKIKDAEEAINERNKLSAKIKELQDLVEAEKRDFKAKENELTTLKNVHDAKIKDLEASHADCVENLTTRAALDLEKKLLDQRKYYEDKIDSIRTAANNAISENNEKVRQQLAQIEELKSNTAATQEKKKPGRKPKNTTAIEGENKEEIEEA